MKTIKCSECGGDIFVSDFTQLRNYDVVICDACGDRIREMNRAQRMLNESYTKLHNCYISKDSYDYHLANDGAIYNKDFDPDVDSGKYSPKFSCQLIPDDKLGIVACGRVLCPDDVVREGKDLYYYLCDYYKDSLRVFSWGTHWADKR